jgi:hypothetical protein
MEKLLLNREISAGKSYIHLKICFQTVVWTNAILVELKLTWTNVELQYVLIADFRSDPK